MTVAVRRPAVAGMFYPGQASALRADVEGLLAEAGAASARDPRAFAKILLAPHAGYVYSGPVAAQAYARLAGRRGQVRRVVLAGPTHRVAVRGIAVPTVDALDTPLGRVRLDRAAIDALADLPQVVADDAPHADEHALEVQLPFLQAVLGDFELVALAVGRVEPQRVAQVLERLWGGDETLIVISSDLSHYLPYAQAQAVDRRTVDSILRLDPAFGHEHACGATPLAGALLAARAHGLQPRLLDLRNSGDTAGDRARVVGYCAVAFERPQRPQSDRDDDAATAPAGGGDDATRLGAALLSRARNAIGSVLRVGPVAEPLHAALVQPGASFVTLTHAGALRGCIGSLEPHRALEDDVRHNARAAAFRDPRFEPVAVDEFAALRIEVSLLGPTRALDARSQADALRALQPGVDGVVLEWRGHHATFLPQVWQQLAEPAAFIEALKRKAGLPAGFWAEDLRVARYDVRKFHEEHAA